MSVTTPFERQRVIAAVARAVEWRQRALDSAAPHAIADDPIDEWINGPSRPRRVPMSTEHD